MFGNKKKKNILALGKGFFAQFIDKKEVFEANISQIEKGEKRIQEDLAQVEENTGVLVENASVNVGTETGLLQTLEELKEEQAKAFSDYVTLCASVKEQVDAGTMLVEQNKHFTSPSKNLSEVPAALREKNKIYENYLREINGSNYEEIVPSLRAEITESYKQLQELENTVHHMVSLLKESNIAATKLLKKFQNNDRLMETSAMRDFSGDMEAIRDQVVGLRNLEEEIVKSGERNKLQLVDIKEEMQAIHKDFAEMDSDMSYLMDLAEEEVKNG